MKPNRAFVAERAAALHCPELLRAGPAPEDLLPLFTRLAEQFAKAFAPMLAPLCHGEAPRPRVEPACRDTGERLGADVGALAANTLLAAGPAATPLLVSLQAGAVLAMVDRTFGGRGRVPDPLPESLPMSADLMLARLETMAAQCLAGALALPGEDAVRPLRRDGSLTALAPFAAEAPLAVVRIAMAAPDGEAWPLLLAMPMADLPALLGEDKARAVPPAPRQPADPASEPFAALPLELAAVLVDMRMPMAALAGLEPGKVLPVAVERAVPLRLAGRTIARGTVGAADDRVAIRITQAFA